MVIVAAAAVAAWIVAAVTLQGGAEFLSSLAGVVIGTTVLLLSGILWSHRRITTRYAAAVCALGALLAASAGIELIYTPSEPPYTLQIGLGIAMIPVLWYWMRHTGDVSR